MRRVLAVLLMIAAPLLASAAEQQPAFLQPEVLKAALAINLTDEQKPQFQEALGNFVNGRIAAINKLMRKHNQTNLGRKVKSKTNALLRSMDKEMAAFLTAEQIPAYETYRDTLKSHLQGM